MKPIRCLIFAAVVCCALAPVPAWADGSPTLDKNGTLVTVMGPETANEDGQNGDSQPPSAPLADTGDGGTLAMGAAAATGACACAFAAAALGRRSQP